jgi:hypothetical protein
MGALFCILSAQCLILSEVVVYILNRGIKRLNENIHINPAIAGFYVFENKCLKSAIKCDLNQNVMRQT